MKEENRFQFRTLPIHTKRIKKIISDYEVTETEFFRLVMRAIISLDDMGISIYKLLDKLPEIVKAICKEKKEND